MLSHQTRYRVVKQGLECTEKHDFHYDNRVICPSYLRPCQHTSYGHCYTYFNFFCSHVQPVCQCRHQKYAVSSTITTRHNRAGQISLVNSMGHAQWAFCEDFVSGRTCWLELYRVKGSVECEIGQQACNTVLLNVNQWCQSSCKIPHVNLKTSRTS